MDDIKELNEFIGKELKEELREEADKSPHGARVLLTRPDHYQSCDIHINMFIHFDEDYKISKIDGNKCYSRYKGMYNRSSGVFDRDWSKKDIAYLKKFVKSIIK